MILLWLLLWGFDYNFCSCDFGNDDDNEDDNYDNSDYDSRLQIIKLLFTTSPVYVFLVDKIQYIPCAILYNFSLLMDWH